MQNKFNKLFLQPPQASVQEHITRLFVFTMMWSIGAVCELQDRVKFEKYMRENFPQLDYPSTCLDTTDTMFDYHVDESGLYSSL